MEKTITRLTVYFEDPFWVGGYERECGKHYEAAKITFGAEPKDYEVYAFLLSHWQQLRFSPTIETAKPLERKMNPKRLQRDAHRMTQQTGIGTKAQQALKAQQEQGKLERKTISREQREAEKEQKFLLREEKRREKHRGH